MLYRNPDIVIHPSRPSFFTRWFTALGASRRRRRAELDLLTMSDHMRRDLGLVDAPLSENIRR